MGIGEGRLLTAVSAQGLMRISDYQRRRILHLIKHFKSAHKQQAAFSAAHSLNGASSPAPGRLSTCRAASGKLTPSSPDTAAPVSFDAHASTAMSARPPPAIECWSK